MSEKLKDGLVWIDCEMTGLDVENDALIEVAVIVTDADLNPLGEGIDLLIKPAPEKLENMNDFVREMHTSSGLLKELEEAPDDLAAAEAEVLDYISKFVEPGKALLAGNSIGTDKAFLSRYMPALIDFLHYRVIDVSSVKELARRWYPRTFFQSPQKHGGHRALGDIQDSLMELRYYRKLLFPQGEGPDTPTCQEVAREVTEWRSELN
ncbi:oligoribonuclease [Boudabousia liubingyangii]|uniref:Oligoribonuclease n=1 Tax=Boudabousia liubingyangii TaxID=1921764 RepID=A0A1Q5PML6_9ACTO|nr:oligoribonuclease [Boudabousia liubingyangii]OKL48791.1 oligoribonuclease [Boudabousia liubingyangii]